MNQCINRLAAFVIENLPDSTKARRHCLEDLLEIIGDEHPLHGEVAQRLSDIERADARQMELVSGFRRRAEAASHDPAAGIPEAHLKLAREIIRLTRGEEWTRVDQFVFEVAVLIGRNLQP